MVPERTVAYMHQDKAIVHHLKQENILISLLFVISTYQVRLVVVDRRLVELLVVGMDSVEHCLVDMVKHHLMGDVPMLLKTKE